MKFNVTIASPSPLIALGSLIFNGSAIWLTSVWETKDVAYYVYLDATPYSSTRQPSSDLLFHADNLRQDEEHTVVVQPASLLGSVTVEMDLGDQANVMMSMDDGQLFLQDGFSATGAWSSDSCLGSGRTAGTCHVSGGSGSEIEYTFAGDAITLWGAVENRYALYHISMDGADPISYAPTNTTSQNTTVLAHYSNLGPGSHTLKLTNLPKDGKSRIEIDYAQVYTTSFGTSSTTAVSSPTAGLTSTSTAEPASHTVLLSKGTTIGLIVGSILGALLFALLFFLFKYRQQSRHLAANEAVVVELGQRKRREADEETLASSAWSVKDGLELGRVDSQVTVQGVQRPERAAKGEF